MGCRIRKLMSSFSLHEFRPRLAVVGIGEFLQSMACDENSE